MTSGSLSWRATSQKLRTLFRSRDIFIHDGASMRRVHVSAKTQIVTATAAAFAMLTGGFGIVQAAVGTSAMSGAIADYAGHRAEVATMAARVDALNADVTAIRQTAKSHVARLESRQAFLAAMLSGQGDPSKLAAMLPVKAGETPSAARDLAAMFAHIDQSQLAMAAQVRTANEARYAQTAKMVAGLGLAPAALSGGQGGMGGPYEPVSADAPKGKADPQFRALFDSWKKLDRLNTAIVAIPSARPVNDNMQVNSGFGVRSDPFRGGRAMHAGVDIPGAHATPIYATADGHVGRAGRAGGYGNLVEIEHGRGIQTRYGHLSSILVTPGTRVKRGQLVGLMGSTGRSTGTHLHYEVRIEGRAVNPMPFLQTSDYLLAMQKRANTAVGGPVETAAK
jgi:murein DD-endopeptidase MepM/ murein hydrolase activator NlpD